MRPDRSTPPNLIDYEAERARFRLEVPARFNFVADVFDRHAAERPDELALLSLGPSGGVEARHTFAGLARESRRMAQALEGLGIGRGDVVFVMLPRIAEWYVFMLGAIRLGAVPMPGTTLLTARDIEDRLSRGRAVGAVCDASGCSRVDEAAAGLEAVRHRIVVGEAPDAHWTPLSRLLERARDDVMAGATAADDPMLLYFTSGTVAEPKMVQHTQASYGLGHLITARFWHDLKPGDLHWTISDTGWAKAAWGKLFGPWSIGSAVVQMNMGRPDADLILDTIARHGITTFCAPPTLYRSLVLADMRSNDLSRLRHCTAAGEPLNAEVIRAWSEGTGGLSVHDGYGQTETVNLVANYRALEIRPGAMGKPTPGFDVDIVDAGLQPVGAGEEGQIAVRVDPERPVGLFRGYLRDEAATASVFQGAWYLTGDRAHRDEDGYFWFEGRADDVITSSAYRIGPFEVESALVEHPAVAEAAVVGRDDAERTQVVAAFVILAPGRLGSPELAAELQDHVKRTTAPYKYPREVHFVDELPKTVSGKIRRSELRERLRRQRRRQRRQSFSS